MRLARHISLLGLMGSGKTTIGERLARRLACSFLDIDANLVTKHGSIADIFAQHGEAGFREREFAAVEEALGQPPGVISPGGGAVTYAPTRDLLASTLRIYLDVPITILLRRLRLSSSPRPLLGADPTEERIRELWETRHHLYEEAEIHIAAAEEPESLIESILIQLKHRQ